MVTQPTNFFALDTQLVLTTGFRNFQVCSITQKLAAYLREELKQGRWPEKLPGPNRMA